MLSDNAQSWQKVRIEEIAEAARCVHAVRRPRRARSMVRPQPILRRKSFITPCRVVMREDFDRVGEQRVDNQAREVRLCAGGISLGSGVALGAR
jgi:hypothetical protein